MKIEDIIKAIDFQTWENPPNSGNSIHRATLAINATVAVHSASEVPESIIRERLTCMIVEQIQNPTK